MLYKTEFFASPVGSPNLESGMGEQAVVHQLCVLHFPVLLREIKEYGPSRWR